MFHIFSSLQVVKIDICILIICIYLQYCNIFQRFTLDSLAVYIVYIHGLFIYLHGSRVEPHPIDAFDWLLLLEIINNMASKQAPIRLIKVHVVAKKDKYIDVQNTVSSK